MFNRLSAESPFQDDLSFLIPDGQFNSLPLELRELCEQYNAAGNDQKAAAASDWPVSLFVPSSYEENYAYPLLIWFHDDCSSENELDVVMNAIGDQNYCGLGIRGNDKLSAADCFGWRRDDLNFDGVELEQLVNVTARRLRRAFHIHSERIFAAGCGTGADVAMKLFAESPEWFAGAILIDPPCETEFSLGAPDDLRGKHVLQTVAKSASNDVLAQNLAAVRVFRSAGVDIDVRVTEEPTDACSNDARFIDSWLMSRLNCATYV